MEQTFIAYLNSGLPHFITKTPNGHFLINKDPNDTTMAVYISNMHGTMPLCSGLNYVALGIEATAKVLDTLYNSVLD